MNIRCESVGFSYHGGDAVLADVGLEIPEGDCLLIAGHNGAGKSSLLRLFNGMLKPTSGRILVDNLDTRKESASRLAGHVSVTFQHPGDQIFASTVSKEVLFGPKNLRREDPEAKARKAMEMLQLEPFAAWHPYDLPPALRRLVTIASAIATECRYVAFDEPTVHLSQPERRILSGAFDAIRAEGRSLIVVSHDLEFFLPRCSRILILDGGRITFLGSQRDVSAYQDSLRKAGIRLPVSFRLRPYAGLSILPERPRSKD